MFFVGVFHWFKNQLKHFMKIVFRLCSRARISFNIDVECVECHFMSFIVSFGPTIHSLLLHWQIRICLTVENHLASLFQLYLILLTWWDLFCFFSTSLFSCLYSSTMATFAPLKSVHHFSITFSSWIIYVKFVMCSTDVDTNICIECLNVHFIRKTVD